MKILNYLKKAVRFVNNFTHLVRVISKLPDEALDKLERDLAEIKKTGKVPWV